jgi:uncharacterized protein
MQHPLASEEYVSLETVRKNGSKAARPIWIAPVGNKLVVVTQSDSWKVKHIRNNPSVRLATCNASGGDVGEYIEATARVIEGEAMADAKAAINGKYRWKTWPFALLAVVMRKERVALEFDLSK